MLIDLCLSVLLRELCLIVDAKKGGIMFSMLLGQKHKKKEHKLEKEDNDILFTNENLELSEIWY